MRNTHVRIVVHVLLAMWIVGLLGGDDPAVADLVIAEWTDGFDYPQSYTATTAYIWGETFTCVGSGTLDAISVYLLFEEPLYNTPPVLTVRLHQMANGDVVTPPMASASTTLDGNGTYFQWVSASFRQQAIMMDVGQQYAFSLSYDISNNQSVSFPGTYGYAGGQMIYSWDGGNTFAPHQVQTAPGFQVLAVPVPGAVLIGLLGLGTATAGLRLRKHALA